MFPTHPQTMLQGGKPLLKLTKVAGSILEASSPSLVVANRILDTSALENEIIMLICECGGTC